MYRIDKKFIDKLAQLKKDQRPTQLKGFPIGSLEGQNLDDVIDTHPAISDILERTFQSVAREMPDVMEERINLLRAKYKEAGQKEGHDNTALYLGHLLFACGHFDEAMITYESIIQQKRDDIEVLTRYALSCLKTGNCSKTQRVLLQILAFDPAPLEQNEDIKNDLCLLAQELMEEDLEKAEDFYEFVHREIDERFVPAMIGLGDIKRESLNIEDAKFYYKMADAHEENSLKVYLGLAHCYQLSGNRSKSLRYLQKCEAMCPTNAEIWTEIALIYQELGALQEASRAIKAALSHDPTYEVALIRREQLRTENPIGMQSAAS